MLMNMDEVKILIDFFRDYVADEKKGVRVLLTRTDDFNDANSSEEDKNQKVVSSVEESAEQANLKSSMQDEPIHIRDVNYMLFLKVPTVGDEKKSKKEKA